MFRSILRENRVTLALAAPIIAGQVGQMLMGWADSLMVGRVGVTALAACAFGNTLLSVAFVFGFGVMSSVTVRASRVFGADAHTGKVYLAALLLGGFLGLLLCGLTLATLPILPALGQPPEVNHSVGPYLVLVGISIIPMMLFTAAKNFAEALSRPWVPLWIVLGGVALNVLLNFPLIFGMFGLPALGLTGAGVATLCARMADLAALLLYMRFSAHFRTHLTCPGPKKGLAREVLELLRVGMPAGGQHLAEVGAVALSSLMMGWLGLDALAAHQIALTCATTTLMVPLGIGMAVTVRVGQALGANQYERTRPIVFGGLGVAITAMCGFAALLIVFARPIAGLFVTDAGVLSIAMSLLVVAGFFQIVDGTQVVAINALRGMADVRVPLAIVIGAFWIVALPAAYVLAFRAPVGPAGVWVGLALGLGAAAVALVSRFLWKSSPARLAAAYPAPHA
jgi:MATE family multidrug resistance protein